MISLPQQLPMIQVGPGQVTACDPIWLRSTVRDAARGVNVPDWFADDVVQGVVHFLKVNYNGTVIAIGCLFDKIRHSLKDLGLDEMSEGLETIPPPISISLTDTARRAGSGYELVFYRLLSERFQRAAAHGVEHVFCYGLRKCVKNLAGAKKWCPRCERLANEIREFLDHQHRRAADQRDGTAIRIAIA